MIVSQRNVKMIVAFLKGGLWLPVVLPLVLYKMIFSWNFKTKLRAKLQDKVVLITGASSGIGEALAHVFYNAGCRVILAARRVEELERVQRDLISTNPAVLAHHPNVLKLDLSDLKGIPQKAREGWDIHGRIDILVNNGGVSLRGSVMETTLDTDLKIMVTNYFGTVALTKYLLPLMIQNGGGHIVAVGSVQGKIAVPYRSAYAASKHALQAFFDTLRAEVSAKNIKVTVISPGYVRTKLSINALTGTGSEHGESMFTWNVDSKAKLPAFLQKERNLHGINLATTYILIMDAATASGMAPDLAAKKILRSVVQEDKDVVLSSCEPKLAILLRTLCPNLFFYLMSRRAANPNAH